MRSLLLIAFAALAGCTSDTFNGADASSDAASDASDSSATMDAAIDAIDDGPKPVDAAKEAGDSDAGSCVNGILTCTGSTPCCVNVTSPNYGKCVPVGQCL